MTNFKRNIIIAIIIIFLIGGGVLVYQQRSKISKKKPLPSQEMQRFEKVESPIKSGSGEFPK